MKASVRRLAKIEAGEGKAIDGHAPGLRGRNLNAYVLAGVRSDNAVFLALRAT